MGRRRKGKQHVPQARCRLNNDHEDALVIKVHHYERLLGPRSQHLRSLGTIKTRSSSKSTTTSDSASPAAGTGATLGATSTSRKRTRSSTESKSSDSDVREAIDDIFEDDERPAHREGHCLFHALAIGEETTEPGAEVGMAMRVETFEWMQRLENELKLMEWMDRERKEAVFEKPLRSERLPAEEERASFAKKGFEDQHWGDEKIIAVAAEQFRRRIAFHAAQSRPYQDSKRLLKSRRLSP